MDCSDWSSRREAWWPGKSRRTALTVGLLGYGALPAGLLVTGILLHLTVLCALAWAVLLATAACAPLITPSHHQKSGHTMREFHDQGA